MNTPITFVPLGGTTPNFSITGDKIIAAGTILRIKISSTEKFEETAYRVPSKYAAQIVTVRIAAA
jgi:hypothetical protein